MALLQCPCGSYQSYPDCCQQFHLFKLKPETPEQLMRSRFSAFYYGSKHQDQRMAQYLLLTDKRKDNNAYEQQTLLNSFSHQQWLGLIVINTDNNHKQATQAEVEFAAFFQTSNTTQSRAFQQLHELSTFIKDGEQWLYDSGEIKADLGLKRNQPCFCYSGKKYKHCHGL